MSSQLPAPSQSLAHFVVSTIKDFHIDKYVDLHTNVDDVVDELLDEQTGALFVGQHNSLEETVLLPVVVYEATAKHDRPRVLRSIYGSNLNTPVIKQVLERTGNIPIDRRQGRPLLALKDIVHDGLRESQNLSVYPEGTRSRTGKPNRWAPTPFQGAIDAARDSQVAIIPFNASFSYIPEQQDFVEDPQGCADSVQFYDLPQWVWPDQPLGRTDVVFGEPRYLSGGEDRKSLARTSQSSALNLVRIQPTNVVAEALRRADDPSARSSHVYRHIDETIDDLLAYSSRFTSIGSAQEFLEESAVKPGDDPRLFDLYAGHIDHYLHPQKYPGLME